MSECQKVYLLIILMNIFRLINTISNETTINQIENSLSAKISELKLYNKSIESQLNQEGFILLKEKRTKSSLTSKRKSIVDDSMTTTCKTTTNSLMNNHSTRRLIRRLLHKIETNSEQTKIDNDIDNFMKMNNEELSLHLFNLEVNADGSGETTELTSEFTTTFTTTRPTNTTLSNILTFSLFGDCTTVSELIKDIRDRFNESFKYDYTFSSNPNVFQCERSIADNITINLTFTTSNNNVSILNDLVQILANIVSQRQIKLFILSPCGTDESILVDVVNSCYLIDLCNLCGSGSNSLRGKCLPEKNVTRCECFVNTANPSLIYSGALCDRTDDISANPISSSWNPIIVGVLSGTIGLLLIVTTFLLVKFCRSYSRKKKKSIENQDEVLIPHDWSLPPIQISESISRSNSLTDNLLFQKRENESKTNLPSDIFSIENCYDPINELDAIISDEDIVF